ncbi:MAG: rRNA maturation RNase YbeY [Clostridia bacterium]|nr:rRNA maturation RNase YbeY [Clostridia bacterium]
MNNRIKIDFFEETDDFELTPSLKAYIKRAFSEAVKLYENEYTAQVSVSFVGEDDIREYNRENRSIDKVTDVLSFPLLDYKEGELDFDALTDGEFDEDGNLMLGDVVICTNVAKAQAVEYGHSEEREIVYLFVHSILHLMGFDHMEDEEKARMRLAEEKIMGKIGLTRDE